MFKDKIAAIISTKDRPDELARLFESICSQEIKFDQIIVVDGGKKEISNILERFPEFNIDYIKKLPASLTTQRNTGIQMLTQDITLAAFLDDDIEFEKDSLHNMMRFWEFAPEEVGGASFNNMSEPFKKATILERIFFVNAQMPGKILRSGFQSIPCGLNETMQVDWLGGCAMVFRKSVFNEFKFDEWFCGYAHYEEVDFTYRVSRKYKLFVIEDAKVKHHIKLEKIEDSFSLGRMQIVNRFYFVNKNPNLSIPLCCWGSLGLMLNNAIKSLIGRDIRYKLRFKGNVFGVITLLKKWIS